MHHTCRVTVALICLTACFVEPLQAIRVAAPSSMTSPISPDQRIMEEFVRNIRPPPGESVPWNVTDVFNSPPVCTWFGVICTENRRVTQISWGSGLLLTGTVDLTKLPSSLQDLSLTYNQLSGAVDLSKLPSGMQRLSLSFNLFSAPLDLTKLPSSLQDLELRGYSYQPSNSFNGTVDLTRLPSSLHRLQLSNNQLTGHVDLTKLPSLLQDLELSGNQLSGPVDLTKLPSSLKTLLLNNNPGICGNISWGDKGVRVTLPQQCHSEGIRVWQCGHCP